MRRKGNFWDNAVEENFFKILKSEMVIHLQIYFLSNAKNEVFELTEIWYNGKKIHSYQTPEKYRCKQSLNVV